MRKALTIVISILIVYIEISWQEEKKENSAHESVRKWLLDELAGTRQEISKSFFCGDNLTQLQSLYNNSRMHYKRVEFFVEYCSPREAKYFINGPLVSKQDHEAEEAVPPEGFQRVEELLFNQAAKCDTGQLHKQYGSLLKQFSNLCSYYQSMEITDGLLLEMCQLQLFRIASMNLSGYDATISQTNVIESYWCMEGIEKVVAFFKLYRNQSQGAKNAYRILFRQLESAKTYLHTHLDYNTFDRLVFIVNYINPVNRAFVQFHDASGLLWNQRPQAIRLRQGFLFGKESFNLQYFSIYFDDTAHLSLQAELGKLLFFDPVLSGNNRRSCASCHNPSKAFTDGYTKSVAFDGTSTLPRNAPGLLNVIYQKAFFHDGRAYQLEQQVFDVVNNKNEMQSNLEEVIVKLRSSSSYKKNFSAAFSGTPDSSVTEYSIKKAIAEYEKTLLSFNSRFDQYLHGDFKKLNSREINGYNLFAGKALCGSCHFMPLFNGTVPPSYNDSEFEIIGTPADSANKQLDADIGRYVVTNIPEQKNAFKTPSVRNVELTAPYMHNGIYNRLEQVVEFYHRGGGAGFKFSVPNQTLPFDSLKLSSTEKEDIIFFLKTLTDTTGTTSKPIALPVFENNDLINKRKP